MDVFNGTFGVCSDSGSGALDMANECGVCGKSLAIIFRGHNAVSFMLKLMYMYS